MCLWLGCVLSGERCWTGIYGHSSGQWPGLWSALLQVSEVSRLTMCCWIRLTNVNVELKVVQAKNNR